MIEKRTITGTIEYRAEGDAMPKELGGIAGRGSAGLGMARQQRFPVGGNTGQLSHNEHRTNRTTTRHPKPSLVEGLDRPQRAPAGPWPDRDHRGDGGSPSRSERRPRGAR